jgi:hypothetical protein
VPRFAVIPLLLMLCATARAEDWANKMFETTTHDYGAVARGAKTEYRFVITNLYEEDVHIAGVRSSCGCTTPRVSHETLKTYEKGAIIASFDTHGHLGQKSATLTVTFDKPFYAEVQLQVEGYIRTDVVFNPGEVDFGTVRPGGTSEKRVEVNYAGRNDWQIKEVKTAHDYLEAEVVETQRENGQVAYELLVKLKDNAPKGYLNEQLFLITNDRKSDRVPIEITGRVAADLTVSPSSLSMGTVQPGQKVSKKLVVRGSAPFKIVGVTCEDKGFEFATDDSEKPVHLIPVTYTAGTEPGKVNCKIEIETDLNDGLKADCLAHVQIVAAEIASEKDETVEAK